MRVVPFFEKKQRGCIYCANVGVSRYRTDNRTSCPFDECPYRVLDKYKSYEEFMASEDSKILVTEFFTDCGESGGLYEVDRKPTRRFSDGDGKLQL